MWLIGAMVFLLAAPWVQLSNCAGNGWPHNALRHHWLVPISCHFRDCKALLVTSLTHVSGAIASVQTFTLYLYIVTWCGNGNTRLAKVKFYGACDLFAHSVGHSKLTNQRRHTFTNQNMTYSVMKFYSFTEHSCMLVDNKDLTLMWRCHSA